MAASVRIPKDLSPAQHKAILELLRTGDLAAAAVAAEVSQRTLRRWTALPTFKRELRDAESQAVHVVAQRLASLAGKAMGVFDAILGNPDVSAGVRLRAATSVLNACIEWRKHVDLEERLIALERSLKL